MVEKKKMEGQLVLVVLLSLLTMGMMSYSMEYGRRGELLQEAASSAVSGQEGILRLHVVANSDSEEDQRLKLQVRDQVLAKVQEGLADCLAEEGTASEENQRLVIEKWIRSHLEEIGSWAGEEIRERGYAYPVKAELEITWIPEKVYDDMYFPAGNYEALRITIGEGKGQNWWCVIFPPLCLIDSCNEEEAARLEALCGNKLVLKSRILKLLQRSA